MPGNVVELASKTPPAALTANSVEPIVQRLGDRLRLRLSRELRQRFRQLLGSPIPGCSTPSDFITCRTKSVL